MASATAASATAACTDVELAARDGPLVVPGGVGIGCWAWGDDKGVWGWNAYDKSLTMDSISAAFNTSVASGVRLFDTAETYGDGLSEQIVGKLVREHPLRDEIMVATKFQPGKWKNSGLNVREAMLAAAQESTQRLGIKQLALFQIHAPLFPAPFDEQGHGLADVVEAGLARAVGVSNFAIEELRPLHSALAARGIPLASNQVELSILRQLPISSGLLDECAGLGVKLLAYSPLAMGRLTGKYSAKNQPQGRRGFSAYPMREIDPLVAKMREIGARQGCTPAQVALAWTMAKGAIPIPGAKNDEQASENVGVTQCSLTRDEVMQLDRMGREGGTSNWQHG